MPLYEFECCSCGEITQVLKSKADPESANPGHCKHCGTWAGMSLVLGDSKLKFIGPGFHTTDYPKQGRWPGKKVFGMGDSGRRNDGR